MDALVTARPPSRPPSRGRRWLFRLIVLAGLAAVAEASSYFAYWALEGRTFSFSHVERRQRYLLPEEEEAARQSFAAVFHVDIHPYLGFCYNPEWRSKLLPGESPVTDWGFTDGSNRSPVRQRGPNKVVVGILGASVASIFSAQGVEVLGRELQRSPQFAGKDIEFVSLAVGGHKQPQQLLALNYALALGAEFDIVINLDGLNEVAFYRQDNGVSGVFHLYPPGWHHIVSKMPDPASRRQVGKIAYLSEERARWAALFHAAPLRYSVMACLLWTMRDRLLAADIANIEVALRCQARNDLPYRASGPHHAFHNDREMLEQLVANWERCSVLIDQLCRAHGIRYYHFLQPNQYDPGSKPLSPEEKRVAYQDEQAARPMIEQGYPLLREAGGRLLRRGVRFRDLSRVFARSTETFYFDNCCHFNRAGNEVLAVPIAQALAETPEPPPATDTHPESRGTNE